MLELVMNERAWVEDMLRSMQLGQHPYTMLLRYATYLRENGYKKGRVRRELEDLVTRCRPDTSLQRWREAIDRAVEDSRTRQLFQIDGINITQTEMDVVDAQEGLMRQKLLFTLLCLAKYRDAIRGKESGWINYGVTDIFKLANINCNQQRQYALMHALYKDGLIGMNHNVADTSIKVLIVNNEGESALVVTDMRNLGNQYARLHSDQFTTCEQCGLVIKRGSNRQKYCKACANAIRLARAMDAYLSRLA